MKTPMKKILASSLSLFLVGCGLNTTPGQVSNLKTSPKNAAVTPQQQNKQTAIALKKPTVNYTAEGSVIDGKESIQLNMNWLQPAGFNVQFAAYSDLKFIKVEVMGKNAEGVDTTWTTTDEFVTVSGRTATATVSGIPVVDGDLRIVKITGYDANQAMLPAFSTQSYYFSETGQLAIGMSIDRQSALLSQVLDLLKEETFDNEDPQVENPLVLDLMKTAGDLTKLNTAFAAAMNYDMVTQDYERDPSTFDADHIRDYILEGMTADGLLLDSTAETDLETFLTDGSAQIETGALMDMAITFSQTGGPAETRMLGEGLILMVNDPTSQPMQIPVGTASGVEVDITDIAPGEWTLTLTTESGTVLATRSVTVDVNGVGAGDFNFNVSNQVKELREVSIHLQMLDKMAKWGEPLYLNFASRPGYKVLVDGESRYTHGAMVPVGETTVYVRTRTGKLLGESTLTVAANGSAAQAQNPIVLTDAKASEAMFVNAENAGLNIAPKIARSANGDYTVAWLSFMPGEEETTEGGLMARIYAADGTPKTDAFTIADASEFNFGGEGFFFGEMGFKNLFDIDMDQSGNLVAVWSRYESNFGEDNTNVYAQVYSNAGVAADSVPFRVHRETEYNQFMPSVSVANNGQYVVTWSDNFDHDDMADGDSISPKVRGRLLDINGQVVNADEFYVALPGDPDDDQVFSRTAINNNGDFVVTWVDIEDSEFQDQGALHARVFNADGMPTLPDGEGIIHVTDFERPADMFSINNFGDGDSSFLRFFFGTHDVSMGTNDKNFVVSWTNSDEAEVEGATGLNNVPDSIYARHYYPQMMGPEMVFSSSDTMAVSYDPNENLPPVFEDGESYSYSMAPAVDMNAQGNFVVSWTQFDVIGRNEIDRFDEPLTAADEIDYQLDFDFQSAKKMSNMSLRSRVYTRIDNDLFNPARTNSMNPNVFRPIPFGNFRPENNEGPGELIYFFLFGLPSADVALADNKKPVATWQYFDIFNHPELFFGDGDSTIGTDISARVYNQEIIAPEPIRPSNIIPLPTPSPPVPPA